MPADSFPMMGEMLPIDSTAAADFSPHPLLWSGHAQTLAGFLLPSGPFREYSRQHRVSLGDGDQLVLHDDSPAEWQPGDRCVLLIHGLAGCHASPYMQRISKKLIDRGFRTFRMDLRGCGAGFLLARLPYHSGRSEDAAAALHKIAELCPGSPTSLVGFSLGANITLKLLGEFPDSLPGNLDRAVAVAPPVDLLGCVQQLARGVNRLYDRYFARQLVKQLAVRCRLMPAAIGFPDVGPRPRGIAQFDDAYTAPVSGFGTAANYYRLCSSAQFVPSIRLPTLILSAADDPLVPGIVFDRLACPPAVTLQLTRNGGHMGFMSLRKENSDRRWMDWRVVDWITGRTWENHRQ